MSSSSNLTPPLHPQYLPDNTNTTPSPNSSHGTPHSAPGDIEPSSSSTRPTMPVRSRTSTAPGDLLRSDSTTSSSKGGCWTCRVRRKKCDEERHEGSCKTCKRLQIECLGWGSKRPEWMRDKAEVDAYKANIKAQLAARGMIRGQPKMQTVPIVPSVPMVPHMSSGRFQPSRPTDMDPASAMTDYHTYGGPGPLFPENLIPSGLPGDPSLNVLFDLPTTAHSTSTLFAPFTTSPTSSPQAFEYDPHVQTTFPTTSRLEESALRESHVFYYFQRVRQMQFPFAGAAMTDAVHDLIVQNPFGAIGNAICALASLHNSRMQNPVSTEADEQHAHQFYQEAYLHLADSHRQNGAWTELDATAAIHFVTFWVMAGAGDWTQPLSIACEWLAQQSGLHSGENPKMSMLKLNETARFAAKATMWLDIFASISLSQPPKFMTLYRRLFGSAGGFWGRGTDGQDLRMETLMGCPDEVLLAIAEISALAHWKEQEKRHRRLSIRELVRRGDDIERLLQQPADFSNDPFVPSSGPSRGGRHSPYSSGHNTPEHGINSMTAANAAGLATTGHPDIRQIVASIFRHTATLYLYVVVNDAANPAIPEIRQTVRSAVRSLSELPPSDLDRALVFPILLTGCLTDDATERQFLRHRLQERHQGIGNVRQVVQLMDAVWQRRDSHGGSVDWRRIMHDMGLNILLV